MLFVCLFLLFNYLFWTHASKLTSPSSCDAHLVVGLNEIETSGRERDPGQGRYDGSLHRPASRDRTSPRVKSSRSRLGRPDSVLTWWRWLSFARKLQSTDVRTSQIHHIPGICETRMSQEETLGGIWINRIYSIRTYDQHVGYIKQV